MTETTPKTDANFFKNLIKIFRLIWPENNNSIKLRIIISFGFLLVGKILSTFVPLLFRDLINTLQANPVHWPFMLILSYVIVKFVAELFDYLRDIIFAYASHNAYYTLSLNVFRHLHNLSLSFHLERKTGSLGRIIDRAVESLDMFYRFSVFMILPTFIEIVFVTGVLSYLYPLKYPLIMVTTLISYIAFTYYVTVWRLQFIRKRNILSNETGAASVDSLLNFETVKYFTNEEYESSRYATALGKYRDNEIISAISLGGLNIGQASIIALGTAATLLFAGLDLRDGIIQSGDFVTLHMYLMQLYIPLSMLGFAYRQIKLAVANCEEVFDLLEQSPEIIDRPHAKKLKITAGTIKFSQVAFRYKNRQTILNDFSLEIEGGKTYAIVGGTGAGKSTLVRLLLRFYEPLSGKITIDGQNISEVTQKSLRQQIAIIPQDVVLLNSTIYDNIAYGNIHASEDEIVAAAKLAHIHEFIAASPEGYQTIVGERGLKLSGGEKQRLGLARAILKDAPILILDEATSSLDMKTEREIQQSLEPIVQERTTLVIAHRLSTIIHADQIIVMQKGQIVEIGTHKSLLGKKGYYAQLWAKQKK